MPILKDFIVMYGFLSIIEVEASMSTYSKVFCAFTDAEAKSSFVQLIITRNYSIYLHNTINIYNIAARWTDDLSIKQGELACSQ